MIIKSDKDISTILKNKKVTSAACICSNCGTQYTISIKKLKELKVLLCRKCYNKKDFTVKRENLNILNLPKVDNIKPRGYVYNNIYFDNKCKLAYYVWLMDNKESFLYKPETPIEYTDEDGVKREIIPDFLIKGCFYIYISDNFFDKDNNPYNKYSNKFWWNKYNTLKYNKIKIIRDTEAHSYMKYVNEKYGKDFFKSHKVNIGA